MNSERKIETAVVEIKWLDTASRTLELDDHAWDVARPVSINRYWSGGIAPKGRHCEARLLWSSIALHARFDCRQDEPLIVSAKPQTEHKTLGLWDRDVCEVFVSPDPAQPGRYLEFEVAPTGEWLDLAIETTPDSRETDWEFHSGMNASARIDTDRVLIVMSIPWDAFGGRPAKDTRWRGNLTRCVGDGETRGYLAWRPTFSAKPDFHAPAVFGELVFRA